jgi:imidazolonepropionase-like amidohydrolase
MAIHVRGIALPAGQPVEYWIDGDRLSLTPLPGARTVIDGGFLLPGLADAHSHPGRGELGTPLDEQKLAQDVRAHASAGVTLVRVAGSPDRPLPAAMREALDPRSAGRAAPAGAGDFAGLPRIVDAGVPLGIPGQFPPGAGRIVPVDQLPDAAVEHCQAAGSGWCKIYADWIVDEETFAAPPLTPPDALAEAVRRVHEIGGRVAIHAWHEDACLAAVQAGADSLEHGLRLDPELLPTMAAQGTAFTPTLTCWARQVDGLREAPEPIRSWFVDPIDRLPELAAQAHAAGVTVLAGTDSEPHGRVAEEIRGLAAGLPAQTALGCGSWTCREFFGLPGSLRDGAPADIVAYQADPREDLTVLDSPSHVIVRGQLLPGAP